MASLRGVVLLLALSGGYCLNAREGASMSANPIRRVVSMLQSMQKKVADEGEKEQKQFDKFMCFCETGVEKLVQSIKDAEEKIPQLESDIEAVIGEVAKYEEDVKQHKADREAAKTSMAEATNLREKEAAAFAKESAEFTTNINAMSKAIAALEKGVAGGFLQTPAAAVLRRITGNMDLDYDDREVVASFLSQGQGYAPASGQIIGILKQMKDTMEKDLAEATAEEEKAKEDYAGLMDAKNKQVEALTKLIEHKLQRLGEVGVEVVNMKEDLADTKEGLEEDKVFLKDLETGCKTKQAEWDERCKIRAQEQMALADTIKILNDDDALELFKKTLPSPSFLQTRVTEKGVLKQAQQALRASPGSHGRRDYRLDLIALALRGRKVNFEKVIVMIDDMVKLLLQEQKDDDEKKEWCTNEFDTADDKKKTLDRSMSDLDKTIDDNKETIASLTSEIAALVQGIKDLDKQVAEATALREEEHATFVEDLAANTAALDIMAIAKNRLNKFYNPKLYKASPKRELSEEERITVNMGGTLAPTAAPGGIAGTGVTALVQARDAPGRAPETFSGPYKKSNEESSGVTQMIALLEKDLAKEMQEAEFEENDSQKEYEQMMKDSADKRAADSQAIVEKEAVKADLEAALQRNEADLKATQLQAMANDKYIMELHASCDWLNQYFDFRKEARAGEVESLKKAKAVLSGADYSLIQTRRTLLTRRAEGTCASNTKMFFTVSTDAAGTDTWIEAGGKGAPDTCIPSGSDKVKKIKLCGPGTFQLSRMSCDRHDYKMLKIERPKSEVSSGTDCTVHDMTGTSVDGYLGSWQYSC